jgi:hypothetical protein
MRTSSLTALSAIILGSLIAAACGGAGTSGSEEVIKSTKIDGLTVSLLSDSGELKNGENDLVLSFTDASGNPVEINAASLNFHMPAMGSMPEMNGGATLTTTDMPGRFRAKTSIEMAGTWEAQIRYQGPNATGQTSMTVNAK